MSVADLMNNPDFMTFRTRESMGDQLCSVLTRYRIEPLSRWVELMDLSNAVYRGEVEVKDLPELIAQAFGLDEHTAWRLTRDYVVIELVPVQDMVPGLADQVKAWYVQQPPPSADGAQTYDEYAEAIAARAGIPLSLQQARRLAYLLRLYIVGERTREQTVAFFTRPVVIGGLELTPEQTAVILQFVDEEKGKVQLVDELQGDVEEGGDDDEPQEEGVVTDDYTDAIALANRPEPSVDVAVTFDEKNLPEIAPSHAVATETPVAAKPPEHTNVRAAFMPPTHAVPTNSHAHDDVLEIAAHEKKMERGQVSAPGDARLEAGVDAAVNVAAPTLAKIRGEKAKFADIARMAIKGVRDPYQTRAIIERDFGVSGEPVLELIEAVMQGMEVYNAREAKEVSAPPPPSLPPMTESAVLDKRFAAVAGEMPTVPLESAMSEARVSAARSKEEELHEQASKVDPAKLEAAAASTKPAPATAMLTVGSVPPPPPGEMPMVTDVQFKPRLVGPVEELGTMSPAEFRRLSSNADEAARKVQDLLHALEATSYEDRIRGVQAWRRSPVNMLYAQMAADALNNGITLAEVASRRRNKGEESLTPAELRAVANINAAIRF